MTQGTMVRGVAAPPWFALLSVALLACLVAGVGVAAGGGRTSGGRGALLGGRAALACRGFGVLSAAGCREPRRGFSGGWRPYAGGSRRRRCEPSTAHSPGGGRVQPNYAGLTLPRVSTSVIMSPSRWWLSTPVKHGTTPWQWVGGVRGVCCRRVPAHSQFGLEGWPGRGGACNWIQWDAGVDGHAGREGSRRPKKRTLYQQPQAGPPPGECPAGC